MNKKQLKYIKIIKKGNENFLIKVYKDNTKIKVLIEDTYKDILSLILAMISCDCDF